MTDATVPRASRRHVIFSVVNVLLMLLATAVTGYVVLQRTVSLEEEFVAHSNDAGDLQRALTELQYYQGYGGFIHNFKNYVLRQDDAYIVQARADMERLHEVLDRLSTHEKEEAGLAEAITDMRAVFAQYNTMLDRAESLVGQSLSAEEIDRQVKVNDGPAKAAESVLIGSAIDADDMFTDHVRQEFTTLRQLQYLIGILVFPAILSALMNLFIQLRRR